MTAACMFSVYGVFSTHHFGGLQSNVVRLGLDDARRPCYCSRGRLARPIPCTVKNAMSGLQDSHRWRLASGAFRVPADEDMIIARFSIINGLHRQFFWSASQAIEKYFKCILLGHGENAKFSHRWNEAYKKARKTTTPLSYLPEYLERPARLREWGGHKYDEAFDDFLDRIEYFGGPGVRYNEISTVVMPYDIYKFDTVCWHLRSLCFLGARLNWLRECGDSEAFDQEWQASDDAKSDFKVLQRYECFARGNFAFFPESARQLHFGFRAESSEMTMELNYLEQHMSAEQFQELLLFLRSNTQIDKSLLKD